MVRNLKVSLKTLLIDCDMQFLVIGLDGKDENATKRRQAARQAHIETGEKLLKSGNLWFGSALLDDQGNMNGSMYLVDFKDRSELDLWLKTEPYVTGDVWRTIEIRAANVRDPWQFSRPKEFYERRISS